MPIKEEQRKWMAENLVYNDIMNIFEHYDGDMKNVFQSNSSANLRTEYLYNILIYGFKGYINYTDEELVNEFNQRELREETLTLKDFEE
jgi:formylmethanofuran dehydrogenase subunit E-like metal-binding protein